ncbi:MAG: hypothetical protein COT71_01950 [Candidatus Andersenbacteria bacterium CG10_big_fil_rev_8_21_14_0_10_54_11]|uniref:Histidine phosphatase family protein n=1 Tax=Candidatus Andersenbacteria bacterium CG10_big_fil_rev_8_21_14_0_10_54_11 TaxID=1974485 RepID=A0A2M6WZH5_9BACT|nr:MAG: hypothetical protein COT71_01950 [Candidatus Andersenbacteria bacterium CG10_big_fil_rev_8_21_14_0_10_54_11]
MQLIVIRHGQTDHNVGRVLQGQRLDDPLNAVGRREAQALVSVLADEHIAALYSSPLKRARETAEALAGARLLPIVFRPELMERDFGELSGQTWEDVMAVHGGHMQEQNKQLRYDYTSFGGESHEQVRARLRQLLEELAAYHGGDAVAAVTHGGVIRLLHDELKVELPAHVPNASIHRFEL